MPSPPQNVFQHLPQLPIIDIDISKKNINTLTFLCSYCDESLPNPLPKKLRIKLNMLHNQKITEADHQLFCFMYKAIL